MKKEKKSPLSLALLRAQVALHEASLEVGRLSEIEERVKNALTGWIFTKEEERDMVSFPMTPELLSLLPPK